MNCSTASNRGVVIPDDLELGTGCWNGFGGKHSLEDCAVDVVLLISDHDRDGPGCKLAVRRLLAMSHVQTP